MNTTTPTNNRQEWMVSSNPNPTTGEAEATPEEELFYGRWTKEEEAYALELIRSFGEGTLENVPDGATLRNFLAEKLTCQAKRISKKYEGSDYNGRQRFTRTNADADANELDAKRRHIAELRKSFEEARKKSQEKKRKRRFSRKREQQAPPPAAQTASATTATRTQQDETRPPAAAANPETAAASARQIPPLDLQADGDSLQRHLLSRVLATRLAELSAQQQLNSLQASLAPSFSTGAGGFGTFPHSSNLATGLDLGFNANANTVSNLLTRAGIAGLTASAPASSTPSSQISREMLLNFMGTGTTGMSAREMMLRQALNLPAPGAAVGGIDALLSQNGHPVPPRFFPDPPPGDAGLLANLSGSGNAMNSLASISPLTASLATLGAAAAGGPSQPPQVSPLVPDGATALTRLWTETAAGNAFMTNNIEQRVNNTPPLSSPSLPTATAAGPDRAKHSSASVTQAEAGPSHSLSLFHSAIMRRAIDAPASSDSSTPPSKEEQKKQLHGVAGMKSGAEEEGKPAKRLKDSRPA